MTPQDGPWLLVGLGNPGPAYAATRHNVGHMVTQELGDRIGGSFAAQKCQAVALSGVLGPIGAGGVKVIVARTTTYMNVSGGPVNALLKYFSIPVSRLVVIHDELDVDPGRIRLKLGGGEGGHNGLKDITRATGTRDYYRVRVGIGRPPGRQDPADYVLKPFSSVEAKELPFTVNDAADAVEMLIRNGLVASQQRFHAL